MPQGEQLKAVKNVVNETRGQPLGSNITIADMESFMEGRSIRGEMWKKYAKATKPNLTADVLDFICE